MMTQIGPYIEETEWQKCAKELKESLPEQFSSWEGPIFDARHVSMINKEGAPLKGSTLIYTSGFAITKL